MADTPKYSNQQKSAYRIRILMSIVVAQLLCIAIVKFWPVQANERGSFNQNDFSEDVVTLEDAVITRQSSSPPPPPKPTAPIPEPTDEIIEEEITEINNIEFSENPDPLSEAVIGEQGDEEGPVSGNPQQPPRIIRIVEPATPDAAQQANIKAEITVNMLVDKAGKVQEASIKEIRLYDSPNSSDYKMVQTIGYGLTEATLNAALQWTFKPARSNGEVVWAYSTQIFTFGF
ncbi:hypothetical protein [Fodinibius salsisoli]|uniref:TonB C-terminal domain-containing protein n=1 Tax=Fodinibius salsisoli TaxID=2820877 RepID=A0ABT3PSZ3_9BACT|nr:hypothetical protein [Fodinibius salsisoli]MCW9708947.1 hypothetical protein [Fodinibius salsisoli]